VDAKTVRIIVALPEVHDDHGWNCAGCHRLQVHWLTKHHCLDVQGEQEIVQVVCPLTIKSRMLTKPEDWISNCGKYVYRVAFYLATPKNPQLSVNDMSPSSPSPTENGSAW